MSNEQFFNKLAEKWSKDFCNLFNVDPNEKPKFFITVAFPYTNSPFHIGHGRTYVTADIYARYMRMKGHNVLFPLAFQFTGTPILSMSEAIKRGDKDIISEFIDIYGIPREKLEEFTDPLKLAEYFKNEMENTAKKLGLSIDWRREFTTVDKRFEKFIQWQFRKLKDKGYVSQSTEAVGFCPNDNFPVGMHDTKGDIEPEIVKQNVILFENNDYLFPVVTPRPETIFGATALMINPKATYIIVKKDSKKWILTDKAFSKLSYQMNLEKIGEIKLEDLLKIKVINPLTGEKLDIIPNKIVEPDVGTGIVMAVPSHEPLHYLALIESGIKPELKRIIYTSEYEDIPSVEVVSIAGTKTPAELKDYIESLYKIEYYKGYMANDLENLVPDFMKQYIKDEINGKPVKDAREKIIELLKKLGHYDNIYEISNGPIYCRCGTEIVVKMMQNQLFINYDDPNWKSLTLKSLDKIKIIPEDERKDLEKVIFSLNKRACSRSRGLGARLPWDNSQIVDSLSDSTIYTVFYTIAHKLPQDPEKLQDVFWNYVLLGEGDVNKISEELQLDKKILEDIKSEFEYWYPVDSRHSGRDLIRNHLPFYLYNHLAIFGEKYLPRSIIINGFVRVGGKKMSKSFGNVYPLFKAINEFGADPIRLALTVSSEISEDTDFSSYITNSISNQLKRIYDTIMFFSKMEVSNDIKDEDIWFSSILHYKIKEISSLMDNLEFRKAYNIILYEFYELLKEYLEFRKNPNKDILNKFIDSWIKLLSPGAPFISEELWHSRYSTFVSKESFPNASDFQLDKKILMSMEYIRYLIDYINKMESILNKKSEKIIFYVTRPEKIGYIRDVINAVRAHKELPESDYLIRIRNNLQQIPDLIKDLILEYDLDEFNTIVGNVNFLLNKLNVDEIRVYYSDDPEAPDIKGKKGIALPLMPSIVII
ncbi:leucine--tRNA ligase [Acidianus brierleyi]|uniref:Leucine--tRNA ligase n=1 Tax=Acidianus brierleyi TaxID=41673 RepID=A0A2U9IBZ0_9CREN|nr:leucine--tRNA ligase [Acidianus brierleyi]AWR93514.1 leucine--tRNA ligase [Acidianus brierleyi]